MELPTSLIWRRLDCLYKIGGSDKPEKGSLFPQGREAGEPANGVFYLLNRFLRHWQFCGDPKFFEDSLGDPDLCPNTIFHGMRFGS